MSPDDKKNLASEHISDPLDERTPAEETGFEASSRPASTSASQPQKGTPTSTVREQTTGSSTSTNPFRRSSPKTSPKPSSPGSKNPSVTTHTRVVSNSSTHGFPAYSDEPVRRSAEHSRPPSASLSSSSRPRRSSSLRERYPGDTSHRPLETLIKDNKHANHAPHLRKKHLPGADTIDKLDDAALGNYHHEGPYDAASLARNNSYNSSPLVALDASNREALKATPREKVQDSLTMHRPLDGVALVPPGQPDKMGRVLHYQEGADLQREEGGNYKRWPGLDYHPDDLKGKGEPSYSIEKALKEHQAHKSKQHTRDSSGSAAGAEFELVERPSRASVDGNRAATTSGAQQPYSDWEEGRRRSGSGSGPGAGARISGEFKRRFGSRSLRKREGRVSLGASE